MGVLRVSGDDFDIKDLLSHIKLVPCAKFRKGQPKLSLKSQIANETGFNIVTSDVSLCDLPTQISDTIAFLINHHDDLSFITSYPGVTGATLDFGIARRDVFVQNDFFPAELLRLAGTLGIGIELSQYPVSESTEVSDRS